MMTNEKDFIEKMKGFYNVKFEINFEDKTVSFGSDIDSGYITEFHDRESLLSAIQDYVENTVLYEAGKYENLIKDEKK